MCTIRTPGCCRLSCWADIVKQIGHFGYRTCMAPNWLKILSARLGIHVGCCTIDAAVTEWTVRYLTVQDLPYKPHSQKVSSRRVVQRETLLCSDKHFTTRPYFALTRTLQVGCFTGHLCICRDHLMLWQLMVHSDIHGMLLEMTKLSNQVLEADKRARVTVNGM